MDACQDKEDRLQSAGRGETLSARVFVEGGFCLASYEKLRSLGPLCVDRWYGRACTVKFRLLLCSEETGRMTLLFTT